MKYKCIKCGHITAYGSYAKILKCYHCGSEDSYDASVYSETIKKRASLITQKVHELAPYAMMGIVVRTSSFVVDELLKVCEKLAVALIDYEYKEKK